MQKKILGSASCYTQKYYFNEEFQGIPDDVKEEIKVTCVYLAEKIHGIFTIGFYDSGEVYFETASEEGDYHFDEIGSELEIKRLRGEKDQIWKSLTYWYRIYHTEEGKEIRKMIDANIPEEKEKEVLKQFKNE